MNAAILPLDPLTYVGHALHRGERDWAETNCYVDVWIELLHALGHEPLAGLGFTLRTDLEADQWTFFKFAHDELFELYGIDVIELNPWSSVVEQTINEVAAGRSVLIEVDAFHLPDTVGSTYAATHAKTTIAVNAIDSANELLGYFHNQSYHRLDGDNFRALFRTDSAVFGVTYLPPFIEVAKLHAGPALHGPTLVQRAVTLLRRTLTRTPATNPFVPFFSRFDRDVDALRTAHGERYHAYAFANFRQFGAAFSLAASHLNWLGANGINGLESASVALSGISSTAKTLQFRTARAALAGKPLDATPQLTALVDGWDDAMRDLRRALG